MTAASNRSPARWSAVPTPNAQRLSSTALSLLQHLLAKPFQAATHAAVDDGVQNAAKIGRLRPERVEGFEVPLDRIRLSLLLRGLEEGVRVPLGHLRIDCPAHWASLRSCTNWVTSCFLLESSTERDAANCAAPI